MKVFRIPGLRFISLLVLFSSCAIRNYHLSDIESPVIIKEINPVIPDTFSTILYKAQVDLYGKYFGGLLFLKNMNDTNYRLVMTTETGLQLFDFELTPEKMIVHQCTEKLNRKGVLNTIEDDFRLLLADKAGPAAVLLTDEEKIHTVSRYKKGKKLSYYFIENKTGYLARIEQASPWFKKVTVSMQRDGDGVTNGIRFKHHNAKLEIRLKPLKISKK